MDNTIYVLGVGSNSIVTIDLAEACGYQIGGLFHYKAGLTGEEVCGHQIIGTNDELFASSLIGKNFALSMGDNEIRSNLFGLIVEKGGNIPTLIHPSAIVSKHAKCKSGVQIYANSIVDPDVIIEEDTIISAKCTVLHGCRIGKHCFFAPDAVIGAKTQVDDFAFVGLNATLISTKARYIGKHAVIGAAAVVTKPVEAWKIVAGMPASEIRKERL